MIVHYKISITWKTTKGWVVLLGGWNYNFIWKEEENNEKYYKYVAKK